MSNEKKERFGIRMQELQIYFSYDMKVLSRSLCCRTRVWGSGVLGGYLFFGNRILLKLSALCFSGLSIAMRSIEEPS